MPDITIRPAPGDLDRLGEYMRRLQAELGKTEEQSVIWTARLVARSLAAGTRKAPKRRKLQPNPGRTGRADGDARFNRQRYPSRVEVWGRGGPSWVYIPSGEGRTHPATKIRRAGLAASSWKWMLSDLGASVSAAVRPMAGVTSVTKRLGANPSVTLENRLGYIERAVELGGKGDINSAFGRAADAGFRYLEKRAQRAAK